MRVNVYMKANRDYIINVRDTDALMEELGLTDAQTDTMEEALTASGEYLVGPYYLAVRKL